MTASTFGLARMCATVLCELTVWPRSPMIAQVKPLTRAAPGLEVKFFTSLTPLVASPTV